MGGCAGLSPAGLKQEGGFSSTAAAHLADLRNMSATPRAVGSGKSLDRLGDPV